MRFDDVAAVMVLGRDGDAGHGDGWGAGVEDEVDLQGVEFG